MRRAALLTLLLLVAAGPAAAVDTSAGADPLVWQNWTDDLFARAKADGRFVLLDLEAVWCHWCHVMADTTYRDPEVVRLIRAQYIPVRVDQDAQPDLSLRYEEWGWPATVVFAPNGTEIVKRRGYLPPPVMASLLAAIIDDPSPGPSVLPQVAIVPSDRAFLSEAQRGALLKEHDELYDKEQGGWGFQLKLIDADSLEYAMELARDGNEQEAARARQTLDKTLHLLDREWGGFYQYSDERDWLSPHYEKILSIQAPYLRLYAQAYATWDEPPYLEAARKVEDYVTGFLTDAGGGIYTSQDADVDAALTGHAFYLLSDAARRALGRMPRIDGHLYARENGWMITALASLYDVTGDARTLERARRAADWALEHRSLPGGGFRHDEVDRGGPYLGDTLAMGQACLSLYVSSGSRQWLGLAEAAAEFIQRTFRDEAGGGFVASPVPAEAAGVMRKPVKHVGENVEVARWANSLFHYTGRPEHRAMAEHAMRYLASTTITDHRRFLTGLLLADRELASEPLHITVIGSKTDPAAKALHLAALRVPASYRRIEWWDPLEGPLRNADVDYPELEHAAAFVCTNKTCSLPIVDPEELPKKVRRLRAPAAATPPH